MEFEFRMRFKLGPDPAQPEELLERLGKSGCDDAVVGTGRPGYVVLDFAREAKSEHDAILSGLRDVMCAIPDAELLDLVPFNLTTSPGALVDPLRRHDVGEAWAHEIERRASELDAGTAETISWESVRRWLRRPRD